jgi:ATP-dependent helicase/nuclease subunit B
VSPSYAALFDEGDAVAAYRRTRILSIVKDVCWALALRARDGGAEAMMFETAFREGKALPPIEIAVPTAEEPVRVAGRIDRLDVLPGDRASVIDYKSGSDHFDRRDVYGGWQLQLMIYLRAAAAKYEPAGASYFRIFEPHIDISEGGAAYTAERIEEAVLNEYRADGIVLQSDTSGTSDASNTNGTSDTSIPNATNDMSNSADDTGSAADIDKPRKATKGERKLPPSEFAALRAAAEEALKEAAAGIAAGAVPAHPKTKAGGSETACTYCSYLGICNLTE